MTSTLDWPIASFLEDLHLAPAQRSKWLTVWPLVLNEAFSAPDAPAYVALRSALAHESLLVDEIRDCNGRSRIRVRNTGPVATLCLSGEKLRGATRQHVAKTSFLVPATGATELGLPTGESRHPECADLESDRSPIEALLDTFHPIARQVGFVACMGDRVAGLEAIGRPEVFRSDFAAMLRPYASDAISLGRAPGGEPPAGSARSSRFDGPEAILAALADAPVRRTSSLGIGDDYRIEGGLVGGSALANAGLVHLTATPAQVSG